MKPKPWSTFGALLLEVVCGRRPIEPPKALPVELILVDWVWDRWKEGAILEVVDKRLSGEYNEIEIIVVLKLGLICSNNALQARRSLKQVVRYLEGEAALPEVLMPPDAYDGKSYGGSGCGGNNGSSGVEFEVFLHLYPSSSAFEKVSTWSDGDVDIEDASTLSLSGSGEGTGR